MRITPDLIEAGRRASDTVNQYIAFYSVWDIRNKWLAFRLADGSYDGALYDTKRDAVRHQPDEKLCAYFCFRNCLTGTKPKDMAIYLAFNREAYDNGMRMPDPDDVNGGRDVLITAGQGDYLRSRFSMFAPDMTDMRKLLLP